MTSVPNPRPRASLGRVLDDLGATLLDLVHGSADRVDEIGGVVIHDPVDAPVLPRDALVLGVGVDDPDQVVALLGELGRDGAVGLVLRAPVPATPEVRAAADASGVALLGLSRGAPWAHLAAMLRSLLAEGDVGVTEQESLGGLPSGDLFAVANAIASLLDAPITIEDRSSRVLAFSGRQDEADPSRVETILGRQVPERYSRILNERGVFRELYRSDQPVFISPRHGGRASRCRGWRSPYARATRCSARSGPPCRVRSARSVPRRSATPRSWWRCTCCGCAPAPTCSAGCAPTCSAPRWRVAPAPARPWTGSASPDSR